VQGPEAGGPGAGPPNRPRGRQIVIAVVVLALLVAGIWAVARGPSPAPLNPPQASHPTVTPPLPSTNPPSTSTTGPPVPTTIPRSQGQMRAGFATGSGILGSTDEELARDLDAVASTRAQWVRFDFDWSWVQRDGPASWDWSAIDRVVDAVNQRGLAVVALPTYTPEWARPRGSTQKHPPDNPQDFANFVRVAAQRYVPEGVTVWEIWNEPNVNQFWTRPNPVAYTALLRASADALRSVSPSVTVLTGGTSPAADRPGTSLSPPTFIKRIYAAGAAGSFDAIAIHPYTFPQDPTSRTSDNALLQTRAIRLEMVARGDESKLIWATETGAPTRGEASVSENRQAQWVRDFYTVWNGWPYTGPMLWYSIRDLSSRSEQQQAFGLLRTNWAPKQGWLVFRSLLGG
jgi:hypothetical protein